MTDLQPSIQRRQVQRRLLLAVSHGGVGQLLQQHRHHLSVSVLGRTVKRRLPFMVLHGSDGKGGEKKTHMKHTTRSVYHRREKMYKLPVREREESSFSPSLPANLLCIVFSHTSRGAVTPLYEKKRKKKDDFELEKLSCFWSDMAIYLLPRGPFSGHCWWSPGPRG